MAYRALAPLAGASLLALALPAMAQDHPHHPTPQPQQPPAADPHAGHAGHAPAPRQDPAPADPHAGHDMSAMDEVSTAAHVMTSPLGFWPLSRDASGTSWQPDDSRHGGLHAMSGDWMLMGHAQFNLVHDRQNGPRGDEKTFVSGMIMGSATRRFADASKLNLRLMLSPDPFMGKDGFPLLLAAGETADGVNPLIDRQHPHELVMEASVSYARPVSDDSWAFAYIGYPGEPAFGPPAFMHRMSAMDSPEAPVTHHWLDSTHIVFGVTTLGWANDRFKVEASAFTGREPDQNRYDFDPPDLDSWSLRASWNPNRQWSLQASWADVTGPEQLEPDEDETRLSASAIHTRPIGADGWWSSTLAWGRKTNDHDESRDAWLLETAFHPGAESGAGWTLFGRVERIQTDELLPAPGGGHGDLYTVSKASVGAVHDWRVADNVLVGVGALYTVNQVPGGLEPSYGGDPDGGMLFLRLKIQ